jgi:hypothetical protein
MSSSSRFKSTSPSTSPKGVKASATPPAPASGPSSLSTDPYYGHEGTSVLCARFVSPPKLFLSLNPSLLTKC